MNPDILIVRYNEGYRIMHGHLHLANALSKAEEILVDVQDEGQLLIVKSRDGLKVENDRKRLPLS